MRIAILVSDEQGTCHLNYSELTGLIGKDG